MPCGINGAGTVIHSAYISAKGVAVSESLQRDSAKQKRIIARNSNVYDHQRMVLKVYSHSVAPIMTLCMRCWNSVPTTKQNYAGKIGNKQNVDGTGRLAYFCDWNILNNVNLSLLTFLFPNQVDDFVTIPSFPLPHTENINFVPRCSRSRG